MSQQYPPERYSQQDYPVQPNVQQHNPQYHGQPYYPPQQYDPQQLAPYGQQYPPQGWQQYPQVNVQTNVYGPSGAVTVAGMGTGWKIFHALMIVGTCGFWLPVYWVHNSSAKRRSVTTFR